MKWTTFVFIVLPSLFLGLLFAPIVKPGEYGAYNQWSGLIYCKTDWACLHEIGHSLDRDNGYPSQSAEFAEALQIYICTHNQDEMTYYILAMTYQAKDGQEPTKQELYAFLFERADGIKDNMPEVFQPFYNWEQANKRIEKWTSYGRPKRLLSYR